ncbi:unnamed protein product [Phytophthora lilii]|uniref:Unnamed protein product n=1 Tax=Phytophthora lilii TaxID=2077276 RepID=A0A9W6TAQ1_9STRA|nr:unnamed protein product [Phytophthora lilii]
MPGQAPSGRSFAMAALDEESDRGILGPSRLRSGGSVGQNQCKGETPWRREPDVAKRCRGKRQPRDANWVQLLQSSAKNADCNAKAASAMESRANGELPAHDNRGIWLQRWRVRWIPSGLTRRRDAGFEGQWPGAAWVLRPQVAAARGIRAQNRHKLCHSKWATQLAGATIAGADNGRADRSCNDISHEIVDIHSSPLGRSFAVGAESDAASLHQWPIGLACYLRVHTGQHFHWCCTRLSIRRGLDLHHGDGCNFLPLQYGAGALRSVALQFQPSPWVAVDVRATFHAVCKENVADLRVEGVHRGYVNKSPYWKRYFHAVRRSTDFTIIAIVAASLVHICSELDLLNTKFASLEFSIASVALKTVILTITKRVALKQGGTHLRKIYVLTAVPTVLINTQVRLVLLRNVKSGSSVRSFVELGMLEPLMRIAKVWHLRRVMKHLDKARGRTRGSAKAAAALRAGVRRINLVMPLSNSSERRHAQNHRPSRLVRRATILNSHQRLLHFHAAESHADMCSEYIAIICSTSIFFFLQHHPRFGWHEADEGGLGEWEEALLAGSWQVGIEMVVDLICCAFELANGIPFHASENLGGFLTAVFTSCAMASVSISTVMCVHDATSRQL